MIFIGFSGMEALCSGDNEILMLKSHFVPFCYKASVKVRPHDATWLIKLQRHFCLGIKDYFKHHLPAPPLLRESCLSSAVQMGKLP